MQKAKNDIAYTLGSIERLINDEVAMQVTVHDEKYINLLNKKQHSLEIEIDKNKKLCVKNKDIKKTEILGFKKKTLSLKKENIKLKKQLKKMKKDIEGHNIEMNAIKSVIKSLKI